MASLTPRPFTESANEIISGINSGPFLGPGNVNRAQPVNTALPVQIADSLAVYYYLVGESLMNDRATVPVIAGKGAGPYLICCTSFPQGGPPAVPSVTICNLGGTAGPGERVSYEITGIACLLLLRALSLAVGSRLLTITPVASGNTPVPVPGGVNDAVAPAVPRFEDTTFDATWHPAIAGRTIRTLLPVAR